VLESLLKDYQKRLRKRDVNYRCCVLTGTTACRYLGLRTSSFYFPIGRHTSGVGVMTMATVSVLADRHPDQLFAKHSKVALAPPFEESRPYTYNWSWFDAAWSLTTTRQKTKTITRLEERSGSLTFQFFAVLYGQIDHRCFQALVAEPMLNRPHRDIVVHPASRTRLAESVQDEVFTDRMRFTRDGHLPFVVTAFRDSRSAVAAVEASTLGNGFQFAQKMILWIAFLVYEDPALVRGLLPAFL
jgi:hypothetical protein